MITDEKKQEIQARLATQPVDTDAAAAFVDWYKEDVPLLIAEIRNVGEVVKAARIVVDNYYTIHDDDKFLMDGLDHALRVLDGKETDGTD